MIHLINTALLAGFSILMCSAVGASTDATMIVLAIIIAGGLAGMKYDD